MSKTHASIPAAAAASAAYRTSAEAREDWVSAEVEIWAARFLDAEPTQAARRELFAAFAAADLPRGNTIAVARTVLGVRAGSKAEAVRALEIWFWDRVRGQAEADRIRADYAAGGA